MTFLRTGPLSGTLARLAKRSSGAAPAGATRALPLVAAAAYLAAVLLLAVLAVSGVADILDRRADVEAARLALDQLTGRRTAPTAAMGDAPDDGSPFLEGATAAVAGAGLMQRLTAAVGRFDGHIASSQLALPEGPAHTGMVGVDATLEIGQRQLQGLLYDLEAGQPYLFVERLTAQSRGGEAGAADAEGPMQVTLTVFGRWRGAP